MKQPLRAMQVALKRDAAVIFALIFLHLVIKQRLVQLRLELLRTDPCDAVSVFGLLTIALAGGVLVVRLIAGQASHSVPVRQRMYVIRAQQAVVSAIFITLIADATALATHPAMWIASTYRTPLLMLLAFLFAAAIAAQGFIARSQRKAGIAASKGWGPVIGTFALSLAVLYICPEWPAYRASVAAHILTVAVGALVLLIATRSSVLQLVPSAFKGDDSEAWFKTTQERASLAVGIFAGGLGFWADAGGPFHYAHHVFIFIAIMGCAITYAFTAAPLGIAGNRS